MALPASGQISFQDFNTDRGLSATAQIDIDTAAIAYSIPTGPHSMDEFTTNAPDGELNTPSAGDFTDNTTEGSVTINSNAGSFIRTLVEDSATEGDEVFVIKLRQDSTSGAVLATSNTVIIGDTSLSPPPPPPPPPPAPCFLLTSIGSGTTTTQVCNSPRLLNGYFSTTSINSSTLYYGPSTSVSDCSTIWPFNIYLQGDGGYYLWNGSSMSGPFTCL